MKKLASTLPNMVIALVMVTVVAGALLGGMYSITKEPIARQAQMAQIKAIQEVAPPFDNNPEADADTVTTASKMQCVIYPAYLKGKLQGAAVKATTNEQNGASRTLNWLPRWPTGSAIPKTTAASLARIPVRSAST